MTIEQAEKLRQLLDGRDILLKRLDDIKTCTTIRGEISDGVNGRPFTWSSSDVCVAILIRGLSEEIVNIEYTIATRYSSSEEVTDNEA